MASRRLDAMLARAGIGTRSEVTRLLRAGRVTVDGEVCKLGKTKLGPEALVSFDGEVIEALPELLHLLMHKPVGYAVSRDRREAPLFSELVPETYAALSPQPAGRLDRDTSGLLVLSTEGALIQRLTHPRRAHPRRYRVRFEGALPQDAVARFSAGLQLEDDDAPTRPALLEPEGPGAATAILTEGRYHQVRRMFAALGCQVTGLHRDRIGTLDLPDDLGPGECRLPTEAELSALLSLPDATPGADGAA